VFDISSLAPVTHRREHSSRARLNHPPSSRHSGVANSVGATDVDTIAASGDTTGMQLQQVQMEANITLPLPI